MMYDGTTQIDELPDVLGHAAWGSWVDLGSVDAIPMGQGRAYVIGERTIAVFRQRNGRLFATDNRCPHRGGPLADGIAGDGKVICPLHAWKIDLESGQCLGENATVRTYNVNSVNGRVILFLSRDRTDGSLSRMGEN